MALITCPDCGNKCSDSAVTCPRCGKPFVKNGMRTYGKSAKILFPFIVGVILTLYGVGQLALASTTGRGFFAVFGIILLGIGVFLINRGVKNYKATKH